MVHCPKCWTKNEEDARYCGGVEQFSRFRGAA